MEKARKYLERRKALAAERLVLIAQYQTEARAEIVDLADLADRIKDTVLMLKRVVDADIVDV